jgi:hypothetical protein
MSTQDESRGPEIIAARYESKILAELDGADALFPGTGPGTRAGDPFAAVMLVKGLPGPAEIAGDPVLNGADGDAACKALAALGFDPESVFRTLSRPGGAAGPGAVARLRAQIEAVDPYAVVALDDAAGQDLAAACGAAALKPGVVDASGSRMLLVVDGLEASLQDPVAKRRVWRQLQALKPRTPAW